MRNVLALFGVAGLSAMVLACGESGSNGFPGAWSDGGSSGTASGGGSGTSSGSGSGGGSGTGSGASGSSSGAVSSSGSSSSGSGGGSASSSGGSSANVSILVYPNGHHAAELIAAIDGAKTSVYMTMYEIDDSGIIGAITSAKSRGLDVKVILDGSTTTRSNNQSAYTSFSGYVTWSSPGFTYTHEKCVMIDHTQAWIMSANAESSVPQYNREYIAIDNDLADVTEAEAIFQADHANQSTIPSGALVVANTNARPDLVALIGTAQQSLDIEDEEFSDNASNGITDAVVAAAGRGVAVRVVVAGGSTSSTQTTALNAVKGAAGASVYVSPVTSGAGSPSNPYLHAKAILVDCAGGTCRSGYVGSENMTTGSLSYNRELGVIVNDPAELAKVESAVSADIGNATKQ
jgi:phosphatidylserine/phosphatidylglycerophosphate/cardiolipin synthase-like enzyme